MSKRYYITQYGAWWSLNEKEFLDLLQQVKDLGEYTLERFKELKNRPSCTYMHDGHPYTRKRDVTIVECLDWDKDTFEIYYKDQWSKLTDKKIWI